MELFYPEGEPVKKKKSLLPLASGILFRMLTMFTPLIIAFLLTRSMMRLRLTPGTRIGILSLILLSPLLLSLRFRREKQERNPKTWIFVLNREGQLWVLPEQHFYGKQLREEDVLRILEEGRLQFGSLPQGSGEILRTMNIREREDGCRVKCMVRIRGRIQVKRLSFTPDYRNYQMLIRQLRQRQQ